MIRAILLTLIFSSTVLGKDTQHLVCDHLTVDRLEWEIKIWDEKLSDPIVVKHPRSDDVILRTVFQLNDFPKYVVKRWLPVPGSEEFDHGINCRIRYNYLYLGRKTRRARSYTLQVTWDTGDTEYVSEKVFRELRLGKRYEILRRFGEIVSVEPLEE